MSILSTYIGCCCRIFYSKNPPGNSFLHWPGQESHSAWTETEFLLHMSWSICSRTSTLPTVRQLEMEIFVRQQYVFLGLNISISLPGTIHWWVLHLLCWKWSPSQSLPPWAGAGLSQSLCRVSVPPPQLWEHWDQDFQSDQEPGTGPLNINVS